MDRIFSLLSNIVNQLFYPIEHIAWAAEKGLISTTAAPWWFASLLTWITSLLINILRYLSIVCIYSDVFAFYCYYIAKASTILSAHKK